MTRRSPGVPWTSAAATLLVLALSWSDTAHGHRSATAPQPVPTAAQCRSLFSSPCLTPAHVRQYYDLPPLLQRGVTGRGRTIAVVECFGSPTLRADLHRFDQAFGLPEPPLSIVAPLGPNQPDTAQDVAIGAQETTLDVEWAHVLAPGARIVVLVSPVFETQGVQGMPQFLQLERYALAHHLADVLSQSWGTAEATLLDGPGRALVAQFHQFYAQAAARGVTVTAASGDNGASGYNTANTRMLPGRVVNFPPDDPLVLAVGGTTLSFSGTHGSEVAWSLSGGGRSKTYAGPPYQRGLAPALLALLQRRRGLPDVAFDADGLTSPVLYYFQGAWGTDGGTSLGAPAWAGIVALADQAAGHDLGSVNAALYRIAASARYGRDFHDIVRGGNYTTLTFSGSTPDQPAFRAGIGWDAVTGLGTPRIANLVADLSAAT